MLLHRIGKQLGEREMLMDKREIRKIQGKSWIEVDGKISYFVANDESHPLSNNI